MTFKLNYEKKIILQYPNIVIWKLNELRIFHECLIKPIYTKRHFRGKSIIFHPFILTFTPNSLLCGQGLLNSSWGKQPYLKKKKKTPQAIWVFINPFYFITFSCSFSLPNLQPVCLPVSIPFSIQLNQQGLYLVNIPWMEYFNYN